MKKIFWWTLIAAAIVVVANENIRKEIKEFFVGDII